tara:strand:+ start:4841 stop:5341 length:501 start_codon:yes stop_codon:yes gene_type:complete
MKPTWSTLSIHFSEEEVNESLLKSSLRDALGRRIEIFIPSISVKGKRKTYRYTLFDGYVFVKGAKDISKATKSPYVSDVLWGSKGASLTVTDAEIESMKAQLKDMLPKGLEVGDKVNIVNGLYSGLPGEIQEIRGEKVVIKATMPLGSLTKVAVIPAVFCERVDDE